MKILKVHIENFGKMQNFDYDFGDGINQIVEENGWGKTTFSVFVKAMFYGFLKTRTKDLSTNERNKYLPWRGGNYGGYLDFEMGESAYRIERFFGVKEQEDTFKLIDLNTNTISTKYSSNIGEEIFGLDAQAFEKCTYLPQKALESGINGSLNTKLINMIHGTSFDDSYEKAIGIIDEKKFYLKHRGGGKISELEEEIREKQKNIEEIKRLDSVVLSLQARLENENESIKEFESQKKQIEEKIASFGKIKEAAANKKYIQEIKENLHNLNLKKEKNLRILNNHSLKTEDIDFQNQIINDINENLTKQKMLKQEKAENQNVQIDEYFNHAIPSPEEVKEKIELCQKINSLKSEIQSLKAQEKQEIVKKSKWFVLPLILSFLLVICGGLLVASFFKISMIVFVASLVLLIIAGFLYFKGYLEKKSTKASSGSADERHIRQCEEILKNLEEGLDRFLSKYQIGQEEGLKALYQMLEKINEYNLTNSKNEKIDIMLEEIEGTLQSLNLKQLEFFEKFNFEETALSVKDKLKILSDVLFENEEDGRLREEFQKKLEGAKYQEIPDEPIEDVDIFSIQEEEKQLQNEIDKAKERKTGIFNKICDIQNEMSILGDLENELALLKDNKKDLEKELNIISTAEKFLASANENLSSKYLKPIKEGLNKYLGLVSMTDAKANIDIKLNVKFESFGKLREIDYFSKGIQGAIDLSLRFALIDTLFDKEKPFLILDDPLVNLDKDKTEKALALLKEVSKNYQIIYLTCHDARAI